MKESVRKRSTTIHTDWHCYAGGLCNPQVVSNICEQSKKGTFIVRLFHLIDFQRAVNVNGGDLLRDSAARLAPIPISPSSTVNLTIFRQFNDTNINITQVQYVNNVQSHKKQQKNWCVQLVFHHHSGSTTLFLSAATKTSDKRTSY